jgi:hypothetical protein
MDVIDGILFLIEFAPTKERMKRRARVGCRVCIHIAVRAEAEGFQLIGQRRSQKFVFVARFLQVEETRVRVIQKADAIGGFA